MLALVAGVVALLALMAVAVVVAGILGGQPTRLDHSESQNVSIPRPSVSVPPLGARVQRDWAPIMAQAPSAYSGQCRVARVQGLWRQPEVDEIVRDVPRPCYNLIGRVGVTAPTAERYPNQKYNYINEVVAGASQPSGPVWRPTDKLWVNVTPAAGGAMLVTWGAKPGVRVEWLLAEINDSEVGIKFVSASAGSYLWHPFAGQTYPVFSVYANNIDVSANLPVDFTGAVYPHP
jgi:hypothetical protein